MVARSRRSLLWLFPATLIACGEPPRDPTGLAPSLHRDGDGSVESSRIAFASNRDGNFEIYVMRPDGSEQVRLTNHAAEDDRATWSPNGQRIAFHSNRDGNFEIYVMNADGSNLARLTNNTAPDLEPSWSPNGRHIVFASERDGNSEIYVMNADGSEQTRLTNDPASDDRADWSPDGRKIAFVSTRDGNSEVYVMRADGSDPVNLTRNPAGDIRPDWSPNGRQLAFPSTRDGDFEIFVMRADGSHLTQLTNNAAADLRPSWSPNGKEIAFYTNRDGNNEIYVMAADGTGQRNLTNHAANDLRPDWGSRADHRDGDGGRRAEWSPWSEPVNLGPPINTSLIEFQPAISKDGLSLYFTSNRTGGAGDDDLWVSQRDCVDRPWGTPVNLAGSNTTFSDVGAELSDDERLLFFHSSRPGGPGANDIYISRRADPKDDFGWEAPKLLGTDVNTAAIENVGDYLRGNIYFNRPPIAGLGEIYYAPVTRNGETGGPAVLIAELSDPTANDVSPSVRTDGREVFFASNRAGTLGLNDTWVSTRRSVHDAWSTPENLGRPVNSEFNDRSVSLSPDGRTLLFDSERPGGVGGRDIWMSTRTRSPHGDDDDDNACRGDGDDDWRRRRNGQRDR